MDQQITLREILARVPTLESQYQRTFREPALTMPFLLVPTLFSSVMQPKSEGPVQLRVGVERTFTDSESLQQLITELCGRYPMLARFRFLQAKSEDNRSIFEFQNAIPMDDSVVEVVAIGQGRCRPFEHKGFVDSREMLDPICSGLAFDFPTLSVPLSGKFISAASLLYLGIFLLGSVVRYQPQIWVHSVTRLATPERTADDQALALIEAFLGTLQRQFPALAVRLLTMSL